ncbi:MAG: nickel-binding protein [Gaiellaceae bacterium]
MAEFLVELYVSRTDGGGAERGAENARLAAEELAGEGTAVRYIRSIFVPEDETCFVLYEADSAEAVREAARRAALPFERLATAISKPRDEEIHPCP